MREEQHILRWIWLAVALCIVIPLCAPRCALALSPGEYTVVVDAGHGGEDGGAVAVDGTPESGINLQIAKKLEWLLLFLGQETVMTRQGEDAIYSPEATTLREKKVSDLKNRVAIINGTPGALVISIHQNSLPSHPKVHGAKVFYNPVLPAQKLGEKVQATLNQTVNGQEAKVVTAIDSSIYLMKESRQPAILVECGFLSNREESAKLQDASYQRRLVTSIAAGLGQFYISEEAGQS